MHKLSGKVALITGSSRGIGAATAKALAFEGAKIVVNYRSNRLEAEKIAEGINREGGQAIAIRANVADAAEVKALIRDSVARFGKIDILVNNAGVILPKGMQAADESEYRSQFDTNVLGTVLVSQAAVPHFPASGGRIINISSLGARIPAPNLSLYAATKAAVEALTRCFAVELAEKRITVNAVAPGPTSSDMTAGLTPERKKAIADLNCGGRLGEPEDTAKIIAFLAGPESGWINGKVIAADGGYKVG